MSTYLKERKKIRSSLWNIRSEEQFDDLALAIFRFQYNFNEIFQHFCRLLGRTPKTVKGVTNIPFLPISFFKSNAVKTGSWEEEKIFGSSGTTGQKRSKHYIKDLNFYLENCIRGFEIIFNKVESYCFLGILPGYQDRTDSSLIYMVNHFISRSIYGSSGFYLSDEERLIQVLENNRQAGIPTILFGVSFALLDLTKYKLDFPDLIVLETGGMKNSKIELTKVEIAKRLVESWGLKNINSEYGMTELLSQSYSKDGKWYQSAMTKRVEIAELQDPLTKEKIGKTGIVQVLDLANFDTCSFIETQDLGLKNEQGLFQILGRMDNTELRGCNLLLDDSLKDPIS